MTKLPISLVIIALNEESNIERCINSAGFVSEVVLVDSGSHDKTVEIAQKLGAQVFQEPWLGFGPQKNLASSKASFDWILNLDADEALSPELSNEIAQKFLQLDPQKGYEMPRKSFHLGKWISHGGWYPDRQLRLYNRKYAKWSDLQVHEKVMVQNKECLQFPLHHWVFDSLSSQMNTNNRYSSLQAVQAVQSGVKFSLLKLIFKPWSKFIECYFLKFGFLDGLPGFIIAVGAAYSVFLRWSKIWERQDLPKNLQQKRI